MAINYLEQLMQRSQKRFIFLLDALLLLSEITGEQDIRKVASFLLNLEHDEQLYLPSHEVGTWAFPGDRAASRQFSIVERLDDAEVSELLRLHGCSLDEQDGHKVYRELNRYCVRWSQYSSFIYFMSRLLNLDEVPKAWIDVLEDKWPLVAQDLKLLPDIEQYDRIFASWVNNSSKAKKIVNTKASPNLKQQVEYQDSLGKTKEQTYLKIIGCLLEKCSEEGWKQNHLIDSILHRHESQKGISKSTLEDYFSRGRKSLE